MLLKHAAVFGLGKTPCNGVGAGEDWAQESRKPIGEGDGVRICGDEILAGLDEEAGKSTACDFLVRRIAHGCAIIVSHKIPTSHGLGRAFQAGVNIDNYRI
ncbi:MAG: hypothetical protein ACREVM_07570 [Burkholderiales bacterium]